MGSDIFQAAQSHIQPLLPPPHPTGIFLIPAAHCSLFIQRTEPNFGSTFCALSSHCHLGFVSSPSHWSWAGISSLAWAVIESKPNSQAQKVHPYLNKEMQQCLWIWAGGNESFEIESSRENACLYNSEFSCKCGFLFVTMARESALRISLQDLRRINPSSPPQHGKFSPFVATFRHPNFPAELNLSPKEITICIQPSTSPHWKSWPRCLCMEVTTQTRKGKRNKSGILYSSKEMGITQGFCLLANSNHPVPVFFAIHLWGVLEKCEEIWKEL